MKILFIATALFAVTQSGHVLAQNVPAPRAAVVSTAGLDLGSESGARSLDLRILHAASALCGTPSPADPRGRAAYKACRAEVRASALDQRDRAVELARSGEQVFASSR